MPKIELKEPEMNGGRLLYSQTGYPLFQNKLYGSRDGARSCPRGDIRIVEDLKTGLVYNAAFDSSEMSFDAQYQAEQANSRPFRAHLNMAADIVLTYLGRESLVEVGCGKGYFLEMLQEAGAKIHGFDSSYEGVNPNIRRHYFEHDAGVQGKGLILRHVLGHISDPYQFLAALRDANGGKGLIYIEVSCLDWICKTRAWFDIYHEYVNYFRLTDFDRMFERVIASGRMFSGQYLYVVADLATLRAPQIDPYDRIDFPDDLTSDLNELLCRRKKSEPFVVWGGASKGVIFSLLCERAGYPVDKVIDINPAKQGQFLPATGIEVMPPHAGLSDLASGTTIYVMNPNYLAEIREMSNNKFTYLSLGR